MVAQKFHNPSGSPYFNEKFYIIQVRTIYNQKRQMGRLSETWGLILAILCLNTLSIAQIGNKGYPYIQNFSYEYYRAGAQNWCVQQDQRGSMWFGNNYGLLEFDGTSWQLIIQPPNKTIVRSIHQTTDGTTYLGAQNEFGFLISNANGQKRYQSLTPQIPPAYRQFSDVWEIFENPNGIHFLTSEAIFILKNNQLNVISSQTELRSFSQVEDRIFVQDVNLDIYELKHNQLVPFISREETNHSFIVKILPVSNDQLLMVTQNNGLLFYQDKKVLHEKTVINSFLKGGMIYRAIQLRDNYLALGSFGNGVLIMDGNYQPVQYLNNQTGLQSNNITALGTDRTGNLWAATDLGLDYIEIATPLYKIDDIHGLKGTVNDLTLYNQQLFVGTNVGLYKSEWRINEDPLNPKLRFEILDNLTGHVWNLSEVNNELFICHHEGLFQVIQKKVEPLFQQTGSWNLSVLQKHPNHAIMGAYNGIHLFQRVNNRWQYQWKIAGFDETSRIIEQDQDGTIWMAHGYKGIFRLKLSEDLKTFTSAKIYTEKEGFPTSLFLNLFKVKNKILFGTEAGTYQYDKEADRMVPEAEFTTILGNREHIRLLHEDDKSNIWFLKGVDMQDQLGMIDFFDQSKHIITLSPFQKLQGKLNPGFESMTIPDLQNILFGTKNGIILFNRIQQRNYNQQFQTYITEVRLTNSDSLLYGQTPIDFQRPITTTKSSIVKLNADDNNVTFSFSSNHFEDKNATQYRYRLDGFDQHWQTSKGAIKKSYTNLEPGQYSFHVSATNIYGVESTTDVFEFQILPPWYHTKWAVIGYLIIAIAGLSGAISLVKHQIEKAQEKERHKQIEKLKAQEQKFLQEKLATEKELITLRNKKLEAEVAISKSQMDVLDAELASSIMMITQKNQVLTKVKDQLNHLIKKAKSTNVHHIENVIALIQRDIDTEQDWKQFKKHFDKIHGNFLERLKSTYPDVTSKDLQLAAYLRLNLSSKEIASMMNITLRSVEGCRYRLRKHLQLDGETNLNDFIIKF